MNLARCAPILLLLGCSGSPAEPIAPCPDCEPSPPSPTPLPDFQFTRVARTALEPEPQGLAFSPDGRFLAVGAYRGNGVQILDAETYRPVRERIPFDRSWGVAFAEDGSQLAVATKAHAVYLLSFPAGDVESWVLFRARVLIAGPGGPYYATGLDEDGQGAVIRIDRSGQIAARFDLIQYNNDPFGLAVTRDGRHILALDNGGWPRLLALTVPDLRLRAAITLPFGATIVVPLADEDRALVLGAEGGYSSPQVGIIVDFETGRAELLRSPPIPVRPIGFGYGRPWAYIGDHGTILPTSDGTLLIDARDGRIVDVIRDLEPPWVIEFPNHVVEYNVPCCEVLYDPWRDRLLVAHAGYDPPPALYVYEIRR